MKALVALVAAAALSACGGSRVGQDAGPSDAGLSDAAVDAGVDSGVDAGVDSGAPDSGLPDAGDAGFVDHGAPSTTYPAYAIDWPQLQGSDAGVLAAPRFVSVTFDGDPLRAGFESFLTAVGPSTYWQTTTAEYGVGLPSVATPVHLAVTAPTLINDSDIQTFLAQQLDGTHAEWPAPDGKTIYTLVYPTGTSIELGTLKSCVTFGGYHSAFRLNSVLVPYIVMPRCTAKPSVPALSTEFKVLTGVATHELVEAVTDIEPSGGFGYQLPQSSQLAFATFAGAETGDMCEFNPAAFVEDPQLNATVQRTWSNAAAAAGHEPCVPASAGAFFTAVPTMPDDVPITLGAASLMSRGLKLKLGESRTVPLLLVSSADTQGPFSLAAKDRLEFSGMGRALTFRFDRTSGVNGEKVYLTITRTGSDPNFGGAIPFAVLASKGTTTTYWFALVGQAP